MKTPKSDEPYHWSKTKVGPEFSGKVVAEGDRKVIHFKVPAQFQGRRFRFNMGREGNFATGPGPFRVEYFLYNPFSLFDDRLKELAEARKITCVRIPKPVAQKKYSFQYNIDDKPTGKMFELSFKTSEDDLLQSVSVVVDESFKKILECCDQIAARFLDAISFFKQTPLEIYCVEIRTVDTDAPIGRVMIMPYTQIVDLEEQDIIGIANFPESLNLPLRAFREAINSTNPAYQLLCLWGIYEVFKKKLRNENSRKAGNSPKFKRPKRQIPDNELTRRHFAEWIGRSYHDFLDHIENSYRDNIAHLIRKDPKANFRDYALVQHAINTDLINCAQISILQQLILDEWTFMRENGIM